MTNSNDSIRKFINQVTDRQLLAIYNALRPGEKPVAQVGLNVVIQQVKESGYTSAEALRIDMEDALNLAEGSLKPPPDVDGMPVVDGQPMTFSKLDKETFAVIKELVEKSGPDAEAYTDDVAKNTMTGHGTCIDICTRLEVMGLIKMSDDSATPDSPLFCITLTEKGKQGVKVRTSSAPTGKRPGPPGKFSPTGRIFKLLKENPRRPGTHGHRSWEVLRDGMTFEEYRAAGGRANDLKWDLDRKRVEFRD